MVEKSRLSEGELDELRALLDEKQSKPGRKSAGEAKRRKGGKR
jgi:hypothetical protein